MPKAIGTPITITAGQPQREVTRFTVDVTYDAAGVPHLSATGHGQIRVRDSGGNIVFNDPTFVLIGTYADAQITGTVRTGFLNAITFLDTQ
jgi:hypothetical protein